MPVTILVILVDLSLYFDFTVGARDMLRHSCYSWHWMIKLFHPKMYYEAWLSAILRTRCMLSIVLSLTSYFAILIHNIWWNHVHECVTRRPRILSPCLPSCISMSAILYLHVCHLVSPCLPSCISMSAILYLHVSHLVSPCLPSCISMSAILYLHVCHLVYPCLPSCISMSAILYLHVCQLVSPCLPSCISMSTILYLQVSNWLNMEKKYQHCTSCMYYFVFI